MTTHSTKQAVKTSLYASKSPLEWAVTNNGTLYTAQIPIDENGDVVAGGIEAQVRQTLDNLKHTLECANVGMDSVLQVLIYVTDREYLKTVNQVYAEYFPGEVMFPVMIGTLFQQVLAALFGKLLAQKKEKQEFC